MKDKMANVWLRLRHWLIRKLGGYAEQKVVNPPRYYRRVTIHPEQLVCQMAVTEHEMHHHSLAINMEKIMFDNARVRLTDMIVREMIDKGYVVITCEPRYGVISMERVYRAELCLLHPKEWLKTGMGQHLSPVSSAFERRG